MTDEQGARDRLRDPRAEGAEEFSGFAKSPDQTRTAPEAGGDYHPGATSVPKEPTDDNDEGMR